MAATIKQLRDELTALQTQRAAIDVEPLKAAFEAAKAAKAAHKSPSNSFAVDEVELTLSIGLSAAENLYDNARYLARDIDRQIWPLQELLSAPERAAAARADIDGLTVQAAAVQTAVASASATVEILRGQLADASATLASDREHTAQALLAAAKQGQSLTPTTPDRGPVLAIESALALAEQEHDAARQTLDGLTGQITESQRQLDAATQAAAGLQWELILRDFVEAVCDYREKMHGFNPEQSGIMQRVYMVEQQRGVERATLPMGNRTLVSIHDKENRPTAPQYAKDLMAGWKSPRGRK